MIAARNQLESEVFKLLSSLSLTENQHSNVMQKALKTYNVDKLINSMCSVIKKSKSDLRMSAIAFLLSLEIQKLGEEDDDYTIVKNILDTKYSNAYETSSNSELDRNNTTINKPFLRNTNIYSEELNDNDRILSSIYKNSNIFNSKTFVGSDLCVSLIKLFVALNYTKHMKQNKN